MVVHLTAYHDLLLQTAPTVLVLRYCDQACVMLHVALDTISTPQAAAAAHKNAPHAIQQATARPATPHFYFFKQAESPVCQLVIF